MMMLEKDRLEEGRKRYSFQNATFKEEDHPRAEDGKFGKGDGGKAEEKHPAEKSLDSKIDELKKKLEKTDPSKNKSKGKYTDQKVRSLVEESKKWVEDKKTLDQMERTRDIYPKAKASIKTMEGMLEKGEKPDGTKFSKDEKEWLKQQISSKQKLVSRIESENKLKNSSPIKVYRASR